MAGNLGECRSAMRQRQAEGWRDLAAAARARRSDGVTGQAVHRHYRIRNCWSDFVCGYYATLPEAQAMIPARHVCGYVIESRAIGGEWELAAEFPGNCDFQWGSATPHNHPRDRQRGDLCDV